MEKDKVRVFDIIENIYENTDENIRGDEKEFIVNYLLFNILPYLDLDKNKKLTIKEDKKSELKFKFGLDLNVNNNEEILEQILGYIQKCGDLNINDIKSNINRCYQYFIGKKFIPYDEYLMIKNFLKNKIKNTRIDNELILYIYAKQGIFYRDLEKCDIVFDKKKINMHFNCIVELIKIRRDLFLSKSELEFYINSYINKNNITPITDIKSLIDFIKNESTKSKQDIEDSLKKHEYTNDNIIKYFKLLDFSIEEKDLENIINIYDNINFKLSSNWSYFSYINELDKLKFAYFCYCSEQIKNNKKELENVIEICYLPLLNNFNKYNSFNIAVNNFVDDIDQVILQIENMDKSECFSHFSEIISFFKQNSCLLPEFLEKLLQNINDINDLEDQSILRYIIHNVSLYIKKIVEREQIREFIDILNNIKDNKCENKIELCKQKRNEIRYEKSALSFIVDTINNIKTTKDLIKLKQIVKEKKEIIGKQKIKSELIDTLYQKLLGCTETDSELNNNIIKDIRCDILYKMKLRVDQLDKYQKELNIPTKNTNINDYLIIKINDFEKKYDDLNLEINTSKTNLKIDDDFDEENIERYKMACIFDKDINKNICDYNNIYSLQRYSVFKIDCIIKMIHNFCNCDEYIKIIKNGIAVNDENMKEYISIVNNIEILEYATQKCKTLIEIINAKIGTKVDDGYLDLLKIFSKSYKVNKVIDVKKIFEQIFLSMLPRNEQGEDRICSKIYITLFELTRGKREISINDRGEFVMNEIHHKDENSKMLFDKDLISIPRLSHQNGIHKLSTNNQNEYMKHMFDIENISDPSLSNISKLKKSLKDRVGKVNLKENKYKLNMIRLKYVAIKFFNNKDMICDIEQKINNLNNINIDDTYDYVEDIFNDININEVETIDTKLDNDKFKEILLTMAACSIEFNKTAERRICH